MLFHIGFIPAHQVAQIIRILQTGVDLIIAKARQFTNLAYTLSLHDALPIIGIAQINGDR